MTFPAAQRVLPMRLALKDFVLARVDIGLFQNGELEVAAVISTLFLQEALKDFVVPVSFPRIRPPPPPNPTRAIRAANVMPPGFGIGNQVHPGHARQRGPCSNSGSSKSSCV